MLKETDKRGISVILCYNEEATIGSFVLKAKRYLDKVLVSIFLIMGALGIFMGLMLNVLPSVIKRTKQG